jgi:hypothetical protein
MERWRRHPGYQNVNSILLHIDACPGVGLVMAVAASAVH